MKISMIPSNDVKTIHASQNDTQREWCFEPFDNTGTLIIGEESLANIERIKGNTLAFNQLIENGNFASTSKWYAQQSATQSASNNVMTITCETDNGHAVNIFSNVPAGHKCLISCECKTASANARAIMAYCGNYTDSSAQITLRSSSTNWERLTGIVTSASGNVFQFRLYADSATNQFRNAMLIDLTQMFGQGKEPTVNEFKSLFPLSYYSYQSTLLPFKGTAIKTVGKNQIDATQAQNNAFTTMETSEGTVHGTYTGTGIYAGFNFLRNPHFADTHLKGKYRLSFDAKGITSQWTIGLRRGVSFIGGTESITWIYADGHYSFTINTSVDKEECYISFCRTSGTGNMDVTFSNIQLELGETETAYEPFVSSLTDLPTLTYFPTGMKSAGNVYDELTESKAITRFVKYTVTGTEDIYSWSQGYGNHYGGALTLPSSISRMLKGGTNTNGIASKGYAVEFVNNDMTVYLNTAADRMIIINDAFTSQAQWLAGITGLEVVLELATPTETDVNTEIFYPVYQYGTEQILPVNGANPTTAPFSGDIYYADGLKENQLFLYRQTPINYNLRQFALVSKNVQTSLTLKDGKGYCNTPLALTNESGFFDAKLKMTDSDGVCYSEKFQIHVERKP